MWWVCLFVLFSCVCDFCLCFDCAFVNLIGLGVLLVGLCRFWLFAPWFAFVEHSRLLRFCVPVWGVVWVLFVVYIVGCRLG